MALLSTELSATAVRRKVMAKRAEYEAFAEKACTRVFKYFSKGKEGVK
jgi:hypothetical protein